MIEPMSIDDLLAEIKRLMAERDALRGIVETAAVLLGNYAFEVTSEEVEHVGHTDLMLHAVCRSCGLERPQEGRFEHAEGCAVGRVVTFGSAANPEKAKSE